MGDPISRSGKRKIRGQDGRVSRLLIFYFINILLIFSGISVFLIIVTSIVSC